MSRTGDKQPERGQASGLNRFRDLAEYAGSFRGTWNLDYQQLRAARQDGSCRYASDGAALVYEEVYPATSGLRGGLDEGLFAAMLTNKCGCSGRWQGRNAPEHAVAYADPRVEIDVLMPAGARNVAVVMPLATVRELFEGLSGGVMSRALPGDRLFRELEPTARQRLEACWLAMLRCPFPAGTLGIRIAESLVRALENIPGDRPTSSTKAARILFRRAMERCESEGLKMVVGELALDLGVSLGSLELAFRSCMGMPPARYLRRLRLNRARERLLRSAPDESSVGEVALNLGFTELGRFAGEYRKLFGELPSATLRRIQGRQRTCPLLVGGD